MIDSRAHSAVFACKTRYLPWAHDAFPRAFPIPEHGPRFAFELKLGGCLRRSPVLISFLRPAMKVAPPQVVGRAPRRSACF